MNHLARSSFFVYALQQRFDGDTLVFFQTKDSLSLISVAQTLCYLMNIWITLKRWYLQNYFRYVFYITGNVIFLSKQLSTKISQDKSQVKQNKRFSCYQRKFFMVLTFFLTCVEDELKCGTVMDFYSKVIESF